MLIIVTGLPGHGKTLYFLAVLLKMFQGRQHYIFNIDGIDHDFFGTELLDDPDKWYDLPAGAVIAMDEAQKVFPLRMAGSKVPLKCSKFEEHRHQGHDIFLLTQDASLLDVHIRKLAGKHLHVKRLFGTESATIFEYEKYQPKPEDANTIKKAISSATWFYDKKIYPHYKSADLHTVKRKIPFKLIILPVFLVLALVVGYWTITTLMGLVSDDADAFTETVDAVGGGGAAATSSVPVAVVSPLDEWVAMQTPVIAGLPWTAPMYDDVREVKSFPKPHCFIHSMESWNDLGVCVCYSQQVTRMKTVNDYVCRELAVEGWFDHTVDTRGRGGGQLAGRTPALAADRKSVNKPARRGEAATYTGSVGVGYDPRPGRAIRAARLRSN